MNESTLEYRTDKTEFSIHAPLCVVNEKNQILLAAIEGTSTIIRGIVAALRDRQKLKWRSGIYRDVTGSEDFQVTYDLIPNLKGRMRRMALIRSARPRTNVINLDKPPRFQVAYAFGRRPEEIAWDISSQLDIPLLPDWSGWFVRIIREKNWLMRLPSTGMDFAWVFSATRTEFLTELSGHLGNGFQNPEENRGWKVRNLYERIADSISQPNESVFDISLKPTVSDSATDAIARANLIPEDILLAHGAGESPARPRLFQRTSTDHLLVTFHIVNNTEVVAWTQRRHWNTTTEVCLVEEFDLTLLNGVPE